MTIASHLSERPEILFSSAGRDWRGMEASFVRVPRGRSERPGGGDYVLGMHFGRPVDADCQVGDRHARGLQKPGHIGFIPADVPGRWEDGDDCHLFRLSLQPALIRQVVEDLGRDPDKLRFVPQVRFRDPGLEAILCAVKADLESPLPSEPLYVDHLARALVVRLVDIASDGAAIADDVHPAGLSARQLSTLIAFMDANLDRKLHLVDLAAAIGVSVTGLKIRFRNSTGMPVHQYVMRRRVAFARSLIATTRLPVSEIALAAGFAHQSHMTSLMRRLLGETPGEIARPRNEV